MIDAVEARRLLLLLERAHANLDAHPDRYPPRPDRTVVFEGAGGTVHAYTYLTDAGRDEAIQRAAAGETYSAIARSMGLSHSTIRRAVLGITQERQAR